MPISNGEPMGRSQAQQRQWQADRIVEVPRRRGNGGIARSSAKDRGDHFLRRRLAVAARDHGDRNVEAVAPERRERGERFQRIIDGNEVAGKRRRPAALDERGDGARFERTGDEVVAIEPLTFQRDEQIAADEAARIGRDARERNGAPMTEPSTARARSPCPSSAAPARKRIRDHSAIGKGDALAIRFLIVLMTLPRQYDDVTIERVAKRALDGLRAVELHRPRRTGRSQPFQDVVGDHPRIFVPRVVIRDDHAIGETTGDSAHRALAFVAVAATSEHADQPAAGPHARTHAASTCSSASGVCA
jgi:hypothetical protein